MLFVQRNRQHKLALAYIFTIKCIYVLNEQRASTTTICIPSILIYIGFAFVVAKLIRVKSKRNTDCCCAGALCLQSINVV